MFVNRTWAVNIGIYIELAQEHLPIAQLPTSGGGTTEVQWKPKLP